jgi:hypothetical protein
MLVFSIFVLMATIKIPNTYGVPSHVIVNSLAQVTTNEVFTTVRENSVSIRAFFEQAHTRNRLTGEPHAMS